MELGFGGLHASQGDHIGHFYRTRAEWKELLVPYLVTGLKARHKCIALMNPGAWQEELLNELTACGIDVEDALACDQLVLSEGKATPDELKLTLIDAIAQIPTKFSFLRWSGDMTWSVGKMPTTKALMEWESMCNIIESSPVIFFCQYDLTKFSGSVVMDALKTHPLCVIGNTIHQNPYYEQPDVFLEKLRDRP